MNNVNQDRDKDFGSYKKDYSSFLDWLGKYLEEDKDAFKNILFRNTEGNLSIKNTFLIDDIYGILNSHFSLSKGNFEARKEVADYFKINITTLWSWTNKSKLTSYGIGYRVYYKRSEVENSLIKIKKI